MATNFLNHKKKNSNLPAINDDLVIDKIIKSRRNLKSQHKISTDSFEEKTKFNNVGTYQSVDLTNSNGKFRKRAVRKYDYPEIDIGDDPYNNHRENNNKSELQKN